MLLKLKKQRKLLKHLVTANADKVSCLRACHLLGYFAGRESIETAHL